MPEKTTVGGDVYSVTNFWDDAAFWLINSWQTVVGGTKKFFTEVIDTVLEPVSKGVEDLGAGVGKGLSGVGKGLTSWIPILLVVGALALGAYFFIVKGKK
ncbi:MAG: hypothetical protein IMZ71_03100 [Chloroflexi bacterium]|nr:hypothetical protein [Chloroflexota bacterium]